ncbi:hypothetical protein J2045_003117, partial [Peteryoungia aggregata LMG 23059]|nr:hypothetical protein [Peteryoungia aggregata LMG 23059]
MVSFATDGLCAKEKTIYYQHLVDFFQFCEEWLLTVCGSGRISRFTEREA